MLHIKSNGQKCKKKKFFEIIFILINFEISLLAKFIYLVAFFERGKSSSAVNPESKQIISNKMNSNIASSLLTTLLYNRTIHILNKISGSGSFIDQVNVY